MKKWIIPVVIVAAGAAGFVAYQKQQADRQPENIVASNGRLELERIDVASLYAGRVKTMNVDEGSEVKAGDVLAEVDLAYIKAQGKPLVSPIVFTDGEAITVRQKNVDITRGEGGIIDL